MLMAALRDLQWRWKRFVIAMIGVALVFAMGLIMTGLTASFSLETSRTLQSIGAERWAVAADASGPFSSSSLISTSSAANSGGSPVMVLRETIKDGSKVRDIIMMGVEPGQLGSPLASTGADLVSTGQVVIDRSLPGADVDDTVTIGGKSSALSARSPARACSPAFRWCTCRWRTPRRSQCSGNHWPPRCCSITSRPSCRATSRC
jgi:putative ABC transport system permease protein